MIKIAYIILAHTGAAQVARLADRLLGPGHEVYLHVDRKAPLDPFRRELDGRPVTYLPRFRCHWGGFGLVQATLAGLDAALEGAEPDYVILLSGQDYPIKPTAEIESRLATAEGAAFLRAYPLPAPDIVDGGGLDRLERWYLRPSRRWSLPNRYVPFFPKRRLPEDMRPWGGNQFWCLPGDLARHVQQFRARNPGYERFFRRSFVADETFFPMILMNGPHRDRIVDDDLHFIDHPPREAHPRVLGAQDLELLRATDDLFARKFDTNRNPEVLDLIDAELLHA